MTGNGKQKRGGNQHKKRVFHFKFLIRKKQTADCAFQKIYSRFAAADGRIVSEHMPKHKGGGAGGAIKRGGCQGDINPAVEDRRTEDRRRSSRWRGLCCLWPVIRKTRAHCLLIHRPQSERSVLSLLSSTFQLHPVLEKAGIVAIGRGCPERENIQMAASGMCQGCQVGWQIKPAKNGGLFFAAFLHSTAISIRIFLDLQGCFFEKGNFMSAICFSSFSQWAAPLVLGIALVSQGCSGSDTDAPKQERSEADTPQQGQHQTIIWAIKPRFGDVGAFTNGLAPALAKKKWGYIDEKGETAIPARFDDVLDFADNGLARVLVKDKWGYINKKGEEVIPPRFDEARDFADNGLARVSIDDKWGYIDEKGEMAIPLRFDDAWGFVDDRAGVLVGDKWGYINGKGEDIIPPRFNGASDFATNGLAAIAVDDKWGYIDKTGKTVIPLRFDDASDFTANGLALVLVGDKWGYINEKGEEVIPTRFDDAWDFAGDLAVIQMGDKQGYINAKGEEVIPPRFDDANVFSNGLALVQIDDKLGYINEKGEEVIPPRFDGARAFGANGLAAVRIEDKWGFINSKGEEVIPLKLDNTGDFDVNGLVGATEKNDKWGFIRWPLPSE
jgi:hypothetical protein